MSISGLTDAAGYSRSRPPFTACIGQFDRLVEYMKAKPGVWFGTHAEVAKWCKENGGR